MKEHRRGGGPAGRKAGAPGGPGRALDAAQYGLGPLLAALFLGFPPLLPSNGRDLPGAVLAGALLGGGWIVFLRTRRAGGSGWLGPATGATLLAELAGSCLLPWRAPRSPFFSPWLAGGVGLAGAALALWGFACLRRGPARPTGLPP
ncbi:MAG: hypothetical protein ACP5NP_15545 [Acetobacteraceae bacterium]